MIEVGETVQPGQPLMSGLVARQHAGQCRCAAEPGRVDPRQGKAQAQVERRNGSRPSAVTVFPVADPRSDTFKVRLRLPEGTEGVFPGMYIKVGFVAGCRSRPGGSAVGGRVPIRGGRRIRGR